MTIEQADTIIAYLDNINHYAIFISFLLIIGIGFIIGYKTAYK